MHSNLSARRLQCAFIELRSFSAHYLVCAKASMYVIGLHDHSERYFGVRGGVNVR